MKKKLTILMAVIMAFTMLTACAVGGSVSGEKKTYYWLTDMTQYRDGSETINREQISAEDPRVAAAFTYEEIAPYIIVNENFEASLTLPDEMWIDNNGVRTVCIVKVMEDPLGINYEIYECENYAEELEMLLYDVEMDQYSHLYGTAGNQPPVGDSTTPAPDSGSSEQTPATQFEGVYWLCEETSLSAEENYKMGFYLDGNGKYVHIMVNYYTNYMEECTYTNLEESDFGEQGFAYSYNICENGEVMRDEIWVLNADGNIYENNQVYKAVDKETFYRNVEGANSGSSQQGTAPTPDYSSGYPFVGKYYAGEMTAYFDGTYVYFGGTYDSPVSYSIDDLGNGNYFIDIGYGDGLTYIAENDMFFMSSQGYDAGELYLSNQATYEASGN